MLQWRFRRGGMEFESADGYILVFGLVVTRYTSGLESAAGGAVQSCARLDDSIVHKAEWMRACFLGGEAGASFGLSFSAVGALSRCVSVQGARSRCGGAASGDSLTAPDWPGARQARTVLRATEKRRQLDTSRQRYRGRICLEHGAADAASGALTSLRASSRLLPPRASTLPRPQEHQ